MTTPVPAPANAAPAASTAGSASVQLFLDDSALLDSAFVTRTWHEPRRFMEPVLRAEHAWEHWAPVMFGTVLRRDDRWQMWYCGWTRQPRPRVCYAESDDGVSWRKPELGIIPFQRDTATNIVLASASPTGLIDDLTVIDDAEDERWPLKMLYYDSGGPEAPRGIHAARSTDGIHWEKLSPEPVLDWGDRFNALPVRTGGRYVVFGRARGMNTGRADRGRCVYRAESDDLVHWSSPELVLARDAEDPPDLEIYSLSTFPYAGLMMGAIERMHMAPDQLDPEIVWSRDQGRSWLRSRPRPAFIPLAPAPSWQDTWLNLSASVPVERDNELWFYYSGRGGAHRSPYPLNQGAIGLALLRKDGFCSLRAGQRPGWLITRPQVWPGGDLAVNVDCRLDDTAHPGYCHGEVRAEAQTPDGEVVPGYSLEDCTPLCVNTVRDPDCAHTVTWKGRSARELTGKEIRLHLTLREAHLYSFHARDTD